MTSRLYYADAYLTEFTASVTSVDGARVYLDQTAFYPTSGGQPHDLGALGGSRVMDVVDEGSRIAHVLVSLAKFSPGTQVSGSVDWQRRFDHMQQHTGQHLLSALFEELFGHKTVSVHVGDRSSTLDLDTEALTSDQAMEAERRANQAVLDNHSVTVGWEDAATVSGLRKPADRSGALRIVSIDGLDRSACGGTHVRTTGGIGPVAIRRVEKTRRFCRVEFLCGWRALARARADHDALTRMAATMTAAIDELPALVDSQAASLRAADAERRKLGDTFARYRARELYDAADPDASGVRHVIERTSSMDEMRALAHATARLPRALFVGVGTSPPSLVFAASPDSGVDAGVALKSALAVHGGRGGGSPRVAQGTLDDAASVEAVVAHLLVARGV